MAKNVIVRFLSESAGLEKGFKKAGDAASGFGGKIGQLAGKFSMLPGPLGSAASSLGGLGGAAGGAGVAAAGAVAGVGALAAAAIKSVQVFTDLAAEVLQVQRATGATAEDASRLVAVMDDFEVPVEAASKAFFRLSRTAATGGAALADAGVEVARTTEGNVDMAETVLNVADAYTSMQDPAARAALVQAAFGKNAQALIPILEQGREGIAAMYAEAEATGQILSQEEIDKAEEFRLAQDALSDSLGEMAISIGSDLVPVLTDLAGAVTVVVEGFKDAKESGKGIWEGIADELGPVGDLLEDIGVGNPMPWLGQTGRDASDAADGTKEFTEALDEQKDVTADLSKAFVAFANAEEKAARAGEKVADAHKGLADAHKDLDELIATGADGLTDYEEALGRVEVADEAVADAESGVADAIRARDDAAKAVTDALADVVDAEKAVVDAHEDVEDAAKDVAGAEEHIAEIRKQAAEDAKDAALDIATSQNDVIKANANLAKAEERLRQLRLGAETTAAGLAEAEQDVADAHLDVDEATRAVETSTDDLDEATATLAGTSDVAKDAEEARRVAIDGLNTALAAEVTKQAELVGASAAVVTAENDLAGAVGTLATKEGELAVKIGERNTAQGEAHALDDTDVQFADQVKGAKDKVAEAERGVRDAFREARDAAAELKVKVDELKVAEDQLYATEGNLFGVRQQIMAQAPHLLAAFDASPLGRLLAALSQPIHAGAPLFTTPGGAVARQHGGPVTAGHPYRVGERGPEWFSPDQNGTVLPAGTGMGGTTIHIAPVLKRGTPKEIAEEVAWAMKTSGR
jgi:predicted  nucleic acid-binding Zn-ribbon protein